jgi:hypothetical protein
MTTQCGSGSSSGNGPRKRRPRTTVQQLAMLQDSYVLDPMPCSSYRQLLSEIVGLSSRSIQIWFQNRRQKLKLDASTQDMVQQRKDQALKLLNSAFEQNSTPTEAELESLSQDLRISTKCIHVWFQNKLAKQKVEDQFSIKKKTATPINDLSPSYFRPQQRPEPRPLTPNQVSNSSTSHTLVHREMNMNHPYGNIAFNHTMLMPMVESPMMYPSYDHTMMEQYPSPIFSFDSNPPSPDTEPGCGWNPFGPIFSAVKTDNHRVLEQPLFDNSLTADDIMSDFAL